MKPIGIAMIGCGNIASSHFKAVQQTAEVRLIATVDADAARAQKAAREQGASRWYTSVEEVLADSDVEACIVGLPHYLGCPTALQVVRAGRHCLLEKPMALTLRDGEELVRAAQEAGVVLAVGQVLRHREIYARARELVKEGAIGRPTRVRRTRFMWSKEAPRGWATDPAKAGGWLLYGFGAHEVDIALWVNDTYATTVYAQGRKTNPLWNDYDEIAAFFTLADGSLATVEMSLNTRARAWESVIVGEKESMRISGQELEVGDEKFVVPLDPTAGFGPQLRNFVAAIHTAEPLIAAGEDVVRRCLLPLEGIKRSLETGAVIDLTRLQPA